MKTLSELLERIEYKIIRGDVSQVPVGITFDSRNVKKDEVFVAVKGTTTDGHIFIGKAIELGARALVVEDIPNIQNEKVTIIQVKNSAEALSLMASSFYNYPSEKLTLIGVTGTNGKTSIVTLLHSLFNSMGAKCGMLSTIENKIGNIVLAATHTTPDPLALNSLMDQMVEDGCKYCVMEVSSHAIVQNRIRGLNFKMSVFTNITHDHLDYHKTFKNYLNAKKSFFDLMYVGSFALINADDKYASVMVQNTKAVVKTYSIKNPSDFKARIIANDFNGLSLKIGNNDFHSDKVGSFNGLNIMAVYGCAVLCGFNKEDILSALSIPTKVEGRFELVAKSTKYPSIVDYAHTPDALMNVIKTINEIKNKDVLLITVFGCGGNRDRSKRPLMGKIASEMSDKVIITSDNPRNENPDQIINEIEMGVKEWNKQKLLIIPDREMAIKTACMIASEGDIVLVAGKGHEKYQEVNGEKKHFDDKEILLKYLKV